MYNICKIQVNWFKRIETHSRLQHKNNNTRETTDQEAIQHTVNYIDINEQFLQSITTTMFLITTKGFTVTYGVLRASENAKDLFPGGSHYLYSALHSISHKDSVSTNMHRSTIRIHPSALRHLYCVCVLQVDSYTYRNTVLIIVAQKKTNTHKSLPRRIIRNLQEGVEKKTRPLFWNSTNHLCVLTRPSSVWQREAEGIPSFRAQPDVCSPQCHY